MSLFNIFKQLGAGFLPILIFIFADLFFPEEISLIIAIASGLVELLYYYLKDRRLDFFILIDIGFLTLLGLLSLLLKNFIFFKLKPAIIELLFVAILGLTAFSNLNLLAIMSRRYFKNLEINPEQQKLLKKNSAILFWVFLVHTFLIVVAALFWSHRAWAFISGGLFYLLFLGFILLHYFLRYYERVIWKKRYVGQEWLDVVTPEGKVLFSAPRALCHQRRDFLHQVIHVQIINEQDQIYLQKRREDREIQPGKWDTAVGGHIRSGESVAQALQRELREETGLNVEKLSLFARYVWSSECENELVYLFILRTKALPKINPEEATDGRFFRIKKIRDMIARQEVTPNFAYEFELLLSRYFQRQSDGNY